jgi:hypothetical protein
MTAYLNGEARGPAFHLSQSGDRRPFEGGILARPATKQIEESWRVDDSQAILKTIRRLRNSRRNREVSTMPIRTTLRVILCCGTLGIPLGCSTQPTAPSNSGSTPIVGTTRSAPNSQASEQVAVSAARFGDRTPGVIFVTSQGLYYDTFVVKDPLPMKGPFQLLANGRTEFGPGQPGYLGGRWWEDTNANGVQDSTDHFFLCPLLPPGRPTP